MTTSSFLKNSRKTTFTLTLALLTALAAPSALGQTQASAQNTRKLNLEMYWDMETVADPQISPDGQKIVYTRGWVDKINDRRASDLWIMNADGSHNRKLTDGSSPRWSPDGTRVAFVREGQPRGRQLFVRWMDAEGAVTQITHVDQAPSGPAWSPDSKSLAFVMLVPKKDNWNIHMPAAPEGAKWTKAPRVVQSLHYRQDQQGFLEEGFRHIFLVPADGGTPRQLTSGDYNHGGGLGGDSLSWTPDGQEILFSGLRADDAEYQWRESEIYALNVSSKAIRQLTHRKGPDNSPVVSPDGKLVAYTGYDQTDDTWVDAKLSVMNRDGSGTRVISGSLDRTPTEMHWAPDGSGIYFTVEDKGWRNLWYAPVAPNGTPKQLTTGNHVLTLSNVNANGQAVGVESSAYQPGDVVSFALNNPEVKKLTAVNDDVLGDVKLGQVEEFWYDSLDNYKIQGWVVKPPDFDPSKKYPMILTIHGGPHSMFNGAFNFSYQEHAANGYVVVYVNPRGSTGYGSAFGNAIKYAYPSKDFDDLMKGVDTVVDKGYVDTRNLFVYGCSGGGVLTAWTVGHTDRFAAASSNCPVIDWMSFVGTTDGASWYHNFKKMPWEDPSEHLQRSPIMYVGNVKTPTMLMTGELDLRTPISQTEEFYEALKIRKVPTAMVRFNEEFHGTASKPSNFLRTQLYLRYWFEKYSKKDKGGVVTEGSK
jgi:dipeptidyl aminopeptidase/acylaminoacyl peptidase